MCPRQLQLPANLPLADPDLGQPRGIDMLLGNGVFYDLLLDGKVSIDGLRLQNTVFGWVAGGRLLHPSSEHHVLSVSLANPRLDERIARFWEMETFDDVPPQTPEGLRCETHFSQTAKRQNDGRVVVALPFKGDPSDIMHSSVQARHAFLSLEKRLSKNPNTYERYRAFMREYIALGHMAPTIGRTDDGYYLQHHCVKREDSLTTKLRVVFNGSFASANGKSLNDLLMVGPTLQDDLVAILLRMRCHKYLLTADITKMYRQVLVRPEDRRFQRIWWRENVTSELRSYELSTVTYGTASASYLAIKALRVVAASQQQTHPLGSTTCLNDFYVDDLITGSDHVSELADIRRQVVAVLRSGGFQLNKWASNYTPILNDTDAQETVIIHASDDNVRTLGMCWKPNVDTLQFQQVTPRKPTMATKRNILSSLSSVYDPLGLLGPIIVRGKMLMQELWKLQVAWNDPLPASIVDAWEAYEASLHCIHTISIPRLAIKHINHFQVELHGFADASERAYGAAIYLVTLSANQPKACHLLCAKSRVAPLKAVSIPRLELAAALLLAELADYVMRCLKRHISAVHLYSDSEIVLAWLNSESRQFKAYVSNRVGAIHRLTEASWWKHVRSELNPADLLSRGVTTTELINSTIWWSGPQFILNGERPEQPRLPPARLELKCTVVIKTSPPLQLFGTFSKTARVWAYVSRFIQALRGAKPTTEYLTTSELQQSRGRIIRSLQASEFAKELRDLKEVGHVSASSNLLSLNPILGSDGILRVGGRLEHSSLSPNAKHPMILPQHHPITRLIIHDIHLRELHAGVQGCLVTLRRQYWVSHGRTTVKGVIRDCTTCRRAKPVFQAPMMTPLPRDRVTQARPFFNSGVDYAGPFIIKDGSRRSKKTTKFYACVFVCFSTRAVHIESVSELSTPAFLAALERFIARRGMVSHMYSDNATNFMGARNYLRDLGVFLKANGDNICSILANEDINWTFIPPRAQHFGGLWEAAVKQMKHHLRRVIGNALLTLEEFNTILAKVEAILNSRPLAALSEDPADVEALTPGHFLIGEPLTGIQHRPLDDIASNRLDRWQLLQKFRADIWKRWHREYLALLQPRRKWKKQPTITLQPGQLIIIKEDYAAPLQWKSGRIVSLHSGPDGIPRSATIKTNVGELCRPIVRLSPLFEAN